MKGFLKGLTDLVLILFEDSSAWGDFKESTARKGTGRLPEKSLI